jgi:hypothetical protein
MRDVHRRAADVPCTSEAADDQSPGARAHMCVDTCGCTSCSSRAREFRGVASKGGKKKGGKDEDEEKMGTVGDDGGV